MSKINYYYTIIFSEIEFQLNVNNLSFLKKLKLLQVSSYGIHMVRKLHCCNSLAKFYSYANILLLKLSSSS